MRAAYADPPYPGRASRLYSDHEDYGGEVDHAALLDELAAYDGWLLHTTSSALRDILPLCPADTRVMAWVKPWASFKGEGAGGRATAWAWEPVLVQAVRPPRKRPGLVLRDWVSESASTGRGLAGAKPELVCQMGFLWLGLEPDDELDDLFPGSGAVMRAWERWRATPELPLEAPDLSGMASLDDLLSEEEHEALHHDLAAMARQRARAAAEGGGMVLP